MNFQLNIDGVPTLTGTWNAVMERAREEIGAGDGEVEVDRDQYGQRLAIVNPLTGARVTVIDLSV